MYTLMTVVFLIISMKGTKHFNRISEIRMLIINLVICKRLKIYVTNKMVEKKNLIQSYFDKNNFDSHVNMKSKLCNHIAEEIIFLRGTCVKKYLGDVT